ncbi:NADPH-dependent FMN reductase [Nesterenkonia flava]|uniref:NADPH-dependent FMN reductase n=1 Tax=Nesterenkonia flava TaxID=469799 RepID=A0ABU1FSW7_9MICC|nr:NADPH-dependent FMN reductase [Nesterenkonia flava]MDR5711756.1 NADPH-dependent FMN reductase [Nesterenkonia flava]
MVKIGYIVGSAAESSINKKLAKVLVDQAPERVELHYIDIHELPLYHRDMDEDFPQIMTEYKAKVGAQDALLLVSPEHNQSFPAGVKNALDILTRGGTNELQGLKLGITGASPGRFGTINGQSQLRQFLPPLGVKIMGAPLLAVQVGKDTFNDDGTADERTTQRAKDYMEAFAQFVEV